MMSRRHLFLSAAAMLATRHADAASPRQNPAITAGLAAFERHRSAISHDDVIGIVDFTRHSREARLHLVSRLSGHMTSHLVAHGRGSDPAHSGFAERFSNEPGSYASSAGAYVTGAHYVGQHGPSMRLQGLEPRNNNAEVRAIVVHAAWYVSAEAIRTQGKLGRSEGCFALQQSDLDMVLNRLGPGRFLYAATS
jgi:hypothetical protein